MSSFGFLKSFGRVKVGDAVQTGIDALVRWDPKGASQAELIEMEKHLDALAKRVVAARDALDKEAALYEQTSTLYAQRFAAAHKLEEQLSGEGDPSRQASLHASIETLVGQLEKQKPDLDQHVQDKRSAEDLVRQLEDTYATAAEKLKTAKEDLTRAERDIQRATVEKERSLTMAEAARQAIGLSQSTGGLNTALEAMHRQAEQMRQEAEAAGLKAKALTGSTPDKDDPNIAAALALVSGKPASLPNLSDRLAALAPTEQASRLSLPPPS
jgi:chromosome segregation ATPase